MKPIALGEPTTVPAGEYAKEVLTYLGIYGSVQPKAVLAKDVRQVLTYVETGEVDAGIVYSTDAASSSKVKVVATAPEKSHAPAIYPVAVIKTSKNSASARAFEDFLLGAQARAIFRSTDSFPRVHKARRRISRPAESCDLPSDRRSDRADFLH